MQAPDSHIIGATKVKLLLALACVLSVGYSPVYAAEASPECDSGATSSSVPLLAETPLPVRKGPRVQTTGSVPHQQLAVSSAPEINDALFALAFSLPGLEKRPTIVSLPGATGMWLEKAVPVEQDKAIVRGREFAHIHPDGSLHAPLPFKRAIELENKGWGERHPWADRNEGWEGLVMLYSATDNDELQVLMQLITESYNYVTGQQMAVPGCQE